MDARRTPTAMSNITRRAFDKAGVHPDDLKSLDDLQQISVHDQGRPARSLSVRNVRHAARAGSARPCLVRHHRQADRRRLQPARSRHLGRRHGALDARGRLPARHAGAELLRLRAVHRRHRLPLRRRAAGADRRAGVRRHDRAAGAADRRFQAGRHFRDAQLSAGHSR